MFTLFSLNITSSEIWEKSFNMLKEARLKYLDRLGEASDGEQFLHAAWEEGWERYTKNSEKLMTVDPVTLIAKPNKLGMHYEEVCGDIENAMHAARNRRIRHALDSITVRMP